jgi:hypothetical protein
MFGQLQKLKEENPGKNLENAGKPWTTENTAKLLADVQKKKTYEELAELHGRTVGGITSRLREIAADYYFNDERPIKEIEKCTGLTAEIIADAISRRQYRIDMAEKKKEERTLLTLAPKAHAPKAHAPKTQTRIEDSMVFQQKDSYHDTLKELLVVAKDIQRMMKDFHADNFVTKSSQS